MNINDLPQDIFDSIMLRIPLESLVECIYVCQKWKTTILGGRFNEQYLRKSRERLRLLFLYSEESSEPPKRLFQSVCQEKPSLLSSKRQIRLNSDQEFEMVSQPQKGLVCFSLENQFVLCNLGTKKCKPLPVPEGDSRAQVYFFGYDEVGGVFKLLRVSWVGQRMQMPSPPLVLTVNNGDEEESWRSIEAQLPYTPVTESVCINGVLYYGARSLVPFFFKGTSQTGELVFATQSVLTDGSHFLLYYNADTQHLRKLKVEGGSYGDVDTYLDHYDTLLLTSA